MPSKDRPKQLRRRRRRAEETEDDASAVDRADDSQSDGSIPSDADGDADDSDLSETEKPESLSAAEEAASEIHAQVKTADAPTDESQPTISDERATFAKSADTEMMNGLQTFGEVRENEAIDFERSGRPAVVVSSDLPATTGANRRQESFADRKRREHEEYRKNREDNPAFIPTRGAFFMHDQRSTHTLLGRGRGRGAGLHLPSANMRPQPSDATNSAWSHDLHEALEQTPVRNTVSYTSAPNAPKAGPAARLAMNGQSSQGLVRNFSTTRDVAFVQVRVRLPGMKDAITYANTRIRQYTKLPDHRPPLRRDKPVRISLPDKAPRYIFPAVNRSFIFIPRALRPNQQGFGKGRSKFGSVGGYSSRRTSVFGGSVYSPSAAAMSRRSSFAREFDRAGLTSPAGSVRPVVRMPPGSTQTTAAGTPVGYSGQGTPVMNGSTMFRPGFTQNSSYRENWASNMPMHQPRPQKTVSVAGIESPASQIPPPSTSDLQPFSHQLPQDVNHNFQPTTGFYPQHQPHQGHANGTPLSNIPERAVHAQAFQPYQQPVYQPGYYYTQVQQPQYPHGAVLAPMVLQKGTQGNYLVPGVAPSPRAGQQALPHAASPLMQSQHPTQQQYETNGIVYYYDPSQMYVPAEGPHQSAFAMAGMNSMATPILDGNYYYPQMLSNAVYYQQQ